MLKSLWPSFADCSVSMAQARVGLEPACAEGCQSCKQNYSAWRAAKDKKPRHEAMA